MGKKVLASGLHGTWLRWPAVCAFAVAAACTPVKVSSECQARISNCLKNCKTDGARVDETGLGNDARTLCEKNCHELCR